MKQKSEMNRVFCKNGKISCCSVFYPPLTLILPFSLLSSPTPTSYLLLSLYLCRGVKPGAGPPSVGGWGSQHIDDAPGFPSGRQSEWGASRYPVQHGGTRGETGNGLTNELDYYFHFFFITLNGFPEKEKSQLLIFSRRVPLFLDNNLQTAVFFFLIVHWACSSDRLENILIKFKAKMSRVVS